MAQFDVHARPGRHPEDPVHFLLDLQNDLLEGLQTRLVAPLTKMTAADAPIRGLTPIVEVKGEPFLLLTHLLAAVPVRTLGEVVGAERAQRSEILRAVDLMVTGI